MHYKALIAAVLCRSPSSKTMSRGAPLRRERAAHVSRSDDRLVISAVVSVPSMIQPVRRQRRQARILDWPAGGEVVERLKGFVLEAKHVVDRVVEKAADAGRAEP